MVRGREQFHVITYREEAGQKNSQKKKEITTCDVDSIEYITIGDAVTILKCESPWSLYL